MITTSGARKWGGSLSFCIPSVQRSLFDKRLEKRGGLGESQRQKEGERGDLSRKGETSCPAWDSRLNNSQWRVAEGGKLGRNPTLSGALHEQEGRQASVPLRTHKQGANVSTEASQEDLKKKGESSTLIRVRGREKGGGGNWERKKVRTLYRKRTQIVGGNRLSGKGGKVYVEVLERDSKKKKMSKLAIFFR